jgi:emfourin
VETVEPKRPVKIHFSRSGGVAGTRLNLEIETETLRPKDAKRLHELVGAASLLDRPPARRTPPSGADRFVYRISVEDRGRKSELETDEACVSEVLRPLLDHLVELARRARRSR